MNAVTTPERQKVGVIFVTVGCCQAWLKPAIDAVQALLYEISSETGIPILVREMSPRDAVSGALPAPVVKQAMEYFNRLSYGMMPMILINGRIISVGTQPDRAVIKEALLNASPVKP